MCTGPGMDYYGRARSLTQVTKKMEIEIEVSFMSKSQTGSRTTDINREAEGISRINAGG